jgi:hypothetical protein
MDLCLNYSSEIPIYNQIVSSYSDEEEKCVGYSFNNLEDWKNYWINVDNSHQNCSFLFYNMIYSGNNKSFNSDGFNRVSYDFNYIFNTYFQKNSLTSKGNHTFGVPGENGYDDFQEILINTCSNNPQFQLYGACASFGKNFCQKCSPTEITSNSDLLKLCGCQVSSINDSSGVYSGVPPACDPMCNHEQIVKNVNSLSGVVDECNADVCVINNISIVSTESVVGTVNFYQVCNQCANTTNTCVCIMDVDVSSDVDINNNIQFYQYCGENSVCLIVGADGTETQVPCDTSIDQVVPTEYYYSIPIVIWFIFIFIIFLFFIVLVVVRKNQEIENNKYI